MARSRSRYAAVNERRRKREWNRRSTAQLNRRREERKASLNQGYDPANPHRRRSVRGLVNTGYLASLVTDPEREALLAEARAVVAAQREEALRARGLVPVRAHERELPTKTVPVVEHVRSPPIIPDLRDLDDRERLTLYQDESGGWVARTRDGKLHHYRYKTEAEAAVREG